MVSPDNLTEKLSREVSALAELPETEAFSDFQKLVHLVPPHVSRMLDGGRGGGKSEVVCQNIAAHAETEQALSRTLILRKGPFRSMNDLVRALRKQFDTFWGVGTHHYNKSDHVWDVPGEAYIEIGILPDGPRGIDYYEDYYQGRNFSNLCGDEAQQWADPRPFDLVCSNLRVGIPRIDIAANPGGRGHQWIAQRYVLNREAWIPYVVEKEVELPDGTKIKPRRTWVRCPSTYRDNPFIDPDAYIVALTEAAGFDMDLLRAWITGSWEISRGAYFAAVLDQGRVKFSWPEPREWGDWSSEGWEFWLAFDHGTARPSVCYVMARSPGALGPDGVFYPHDSVLLLDEWAHWKRPNNYSVGLNLNIPQISAAVRDVAERWDVPPEGLADDACFSKHGHAVGSLADEYRENGVDWRPAGKGGRVARFLKMKQLLQAAGSLENPGLYVSDRCEYWWATVPFLVHDPKNPEVVEKCDTDHGLDASSMGLYGGAVTGGWAPRG